MDARLARLALGCAAIVFLAANYRTENFIITADREEMAVKVGQEAERLRRELAIEWLGDELPRWSDICPITVRTGPNMNAGGQTSFVFVNREPRSWQMIVEGTEQRVLDSVLPHEITHTIFASHFGCPLPRWADEGACTIVEHDSERAKQEQLLIKFLTGNRGIAFNKMFAMREYPPDILPLYSQGYSLARFLIAQGGKQKFVKYVEAGLATNNWTHATRELYGYKSLSDLQTTWVDWVRQGYPTPVARRDDEAIVRNDRDLQQAEDVRDQVTAIGNAPVGNMQRDADASTALAQANTTAAQSDEPVAAEPVAKPPRAALASLSGGQPTSNVALASHTDEHGGWYARQRDLAYAQRDSNEAEQQHEQPRSRSPRRTPPQRQAQSAARQPEMGQPRQIVLEWSRSADAGVPAQPPAGRTYRR